MGFGQNSRGGGGGSRGRGGGGFRGGRGGSGDRGRGGFRGGRGGSGDRGRGGFGGRGGGRGRGGFGDRDGGGRGGGRGFGDRDGSRGGGRGGGRGFGDRDGSRGGGRGFGGRGGSRGGGRPFEGKREFMTDAVYVGAVPTDMQENDFKKLFPKATKVHVSPAEGTRPGHAFITFADDASAAAAVKQGATFKNTQLKVAFQNKRAEPQKRSVDGGDKSGPKAKKLKGDANGGKKAAGSDDDEDEDDDDESMDFEGDDDEEGGDDDDDEEDDDDDEGDSDDEEDEKSIKKTVAKMVAGGKSDKAAGKKVAADDDEDEDDDDEDDDEDDDDEDDDDDDDDEEDEEEVPKKSQKTPPASAKQPAPTAAQNKNKGKELTKPTVIDNSLQKKNKASDQTVSKKSTPAEVQKRSVDNGDKSGPQSKKLKNEPVVSAKNGLKGKGKPVEEDDEDDDDDEDDSDDEELDFDEDDSDDEDDDDEEDDDTPKKPAGKSPAVGKQAKSAAKPSLADDDESDDDDDEDDDDEDDDEDDEESAPPAKPLKSALKQTPAPAKQKSPATPAPSKQKPATPPAKSETKPATPAADKPLDKKQLFINSIKESVSVSDMKALYPKAKTVKMQKRKVGPNSHIQFAFVTFENESEAANAFKAHTQIGGEKVNISYAFAQKNPQQQPKQGDTSNVSDKKPEQKKNDNKEKKQTPPPAKKEKVKSEKQLSTNSIYVGQLPEHVTEDDIKKLFPKANKIELFPTKAKNKGVRPGFAFLTFPDDNSAAAAIKLGASLTLKDTQLKVNYQTKKATPITAE
ncbi:unnamed protein product [Adineta steineri]|uniref:RRM domain-containing protein n=1 Tax=Adineta steineri TaxID=433720 RepID=A0A818SL14_9BILA|nr:unnamed protein product [Adineta steineri]CAF3669051.1 unnamed protein product [Adineta steineri]